MAQRTANNGRVIFPSTTDENFQNIQENFTELFTKPGLFGAFTTDTTPASGTCAIQLSLTDSLEDALTTIQSGIGYVSDEDGVMVTAVTSVATLTNGSISTIVTGQVFQWISKADGTLGITLTGSAASYYVTLVLPNGEIVVSDEIVVNA